MMESLVGFLNQRRNEMKQKYADGTRVILAAFENEPEEEAIVLEYEGDSLYCVELVVPHGKDDDGLRELLEDHILRAC